jgi:hypothetical protein
VLEAQPSTASLLADRRHWESGYFTFANPAEETPKSAMLPNREQDYIVEVSRFLRANE